jgi:protein O-GlcNAc transferase
MIGDGTADSSAQLKDAFETGLAAYGTGRWTDAEAAFRRVLALAPEHPDALHLLGVTLHFQRKSEEGIALIERAIARVPGNPAYHNNLGNALDDIGARADAEAAYRRATQVRPDYPIAWQALGTLALRDHRPRDAIGHFQNALGAKPDYSPAENGIGNALRDLGRLDDALEHYRAALRLDPGSQAAASNLLMAAQYDPRQNPAGLRVAHRDWGTATAARLPQRAAPFANARDPERRLKVGYLSADFRRHSVAYFIEPVIAAHDRGAVQVTLYSAVRRPDPTTERIHGTADRWRDIVRLSDAAVAHLVEDDGIDILVDLAGHTAGNRLGVFALRPAPVQATWIGYPDITGLRTIGWRITDAVADPDGDDNHHPSESLMRLADGFLCYRPPGEAPPIAPPPSGRDGPITFASFNALAKISADTVALWARVLDAVPRSRLLIKTELLGDAESRARLLRAFAERGILEQRLELIGYVPDVGGHLAAYGRVDIALDTIPYNGTTTTMEALWMGCPVVTLCGDRHATRVGASILTRARLPDLIAETPDAFVRIAAGLAAARPRLAALRAGLRDRLNETTLIDAARFTRGVEAAYRAMWRRFLTDGR